jgi:hypothetical protein
MDQIPPSPAKVTFQDGLLAISAQNSTLGEILREVRKLTGASIEIPANGANERVVTHIAPGAPRDVLAVLLNGSSFNYVMVGSSSDPSAVSSVILSTKPSAAGEPQVQTAQNIYQNTPQPMPPHPYPGVVGPFNQLPHVGVPGSEAPANATPEDDSKDDDQELSPDDQPDDATQQPPTDATVPVQQQPDPNQPNAGPKTPEQIMEMLRRQQQPGGVPPQPQPPQ